MTSLKTIAKDLNYLRQVSKEVKNDANIKKYIEALKDYCQDKELYAISGIQLGIVKRIIYLPKNEEYNELVMINPIITKEIGNTYFWESCLSCLNNVCLVRRPYEIEVTYYNEKFCKKKESFKGFISTVISHEIDHLDGKLILDISEETRDLSKEERKLLREKEPYKIINKDKIYVGLKNR